MASRILLFLLFIIPSQAFTQYEIPAEEWNLWIHPNYFHVGYTGGEGISYRKSFGTVGLFLAPTYFTQTEYQPFVDGKFYFLGKDKTAASAGLGVRYSLDSWNKAIGINAYYDYRREHHFDLHQVGIGLELLGEDWDIRINGYFPLQNIHHHKVFFNDIGGGFIAARRWGARAWTGVDVEFGSWFFKKYPCNYFGLYFAAGPYYYSTGRGDRHVFERKWHRDAAGGRVRLLAKVTDFINVSVCATYDSIWHTRVQGMIMLTLPLDCNVYKKYFRNDCCCSTSYPCNQVLIQPVARNGIIVADKASSFEWNWSEHCSSYTCGPTSLKIGFDHSEN